MNIRTNIRNVLGLALAVISTTGCQSVSSSVSASQAYLGSFEFAYVGGNTYRVDVPDETTIRWTCTAGDEKGRSERERVDRRSLAKHLYFVSWTESDGTIVTQVLDLNRNAVTSTISNGTNRFVLDGSVTRLSTQ